MGISLYGMLAAIWKERWRPKPIYRSLCVWNAHATHTMLRSISWGLGYTYHRCDLLTQTHAFFIPWKTFSIHTPTYTAHFWSNYVGGRFCICFTIYNQIHCELSAKALRTGRKWENFLWICVHVCTQSIRGPLGITHIFSPPQHIMFNKQEKSYANENWRKLAKLIAHTHICMDISIPQESLSLTRRGNMICGSHT